MSIDRHQAIAFVRDKLHIKEVQDTKLDLELLNKITRGLLSEVPFQNVTLFATEPEKRVPSAEDVIELGMSLRGGVCIHNNWFAALLLKAIGFNLFTIVGSYAAGGNFQNDHLMSVVKDLKDPEDPNCNETLFLVDVGNGYPTPGAAPLHRLPHDFPLTAGLELRYAKYGDFYYRLHRFGDPSPDPESPSLDGWSAKFSFTLNERDPNSLHESMKSIFTTEPPSHFMSHIRLFRWPQDHNGCAVAFRGEDLLFFGCNNNDGKNSDTNGGKQKIPVEISDWERTIMKYFPSIDSLELKKALPCIYKIMNLVPKP